MSTYLAWAPMVTNAQITKELLNQLGENDAFFRQAPAFYSPPTSDPNITTTSNSMVDLSGFSLPHTSQGGLIEISFLARLSVVTIRVDLLIDGISITGDNDGVGAPPVTGSFSAIRYARPAAGLHTYKVQWRTTAGTGTLYPAGLAQFMVREITA